MIKFLKSVEIWQNYADQYVASFFDPPYTCRKFNANIRNYSSIIGTRRRRRQTKLLSRPWRRSVHGDGAQIFIRLSASTYTPIWLMAWQTYCFSSLGIRLVSATLDRYSRHLNHIATSGKHQLETSERYLLTHADQCSDFIPESSHSRSHRPLNVATV